MDFQHGCLSDGIIPTYRQKNQEQEETIALHFLLMDIVAESESVGEVSMKRAIIVCLICLSQSGPGEVTQRCRSRPGLVKRRGEGEEKLNKFNHPAVHPPSSSARVVVLYGSVWGLSGPYRAPNRIFLLKDSVQLSHG